MGAGSSAPVPGGGTDGYHVLRVQDNSPGHKAGLEAFFDFIIAIGNTRLNEDNDKLRELLSANKDKPVQALVYSSKTQVCREVTIVPSDGWGGQGLLGVSIRFCSFQGANENVWHVLDVQPNSPAALAGFVSDSDYIIGADALLQDAEDLFAMIEAHDNKPLKLYVYSTVSDSCRELTIVPNSAWGGEGLLGCNIGYGYLHRIPLSQSPDSLSDSDRTGSVSNGNGFADVPLSSSSGSPTVHQQQQQQPLYSGGHGHSHDQPLPPPPAPPQQQQQPLPPPPPPPTQQPLTDFPAVSTQLSLPGMPPVSVSVPSMHLPRSSQPETAAANPTLNATTVAP
ncbi:hypothetical protein BOX15_Mlig018024g1 [Macrostomum lignano]|uniref:PDZ GRASP-type domain-containing protein n=2 Tax=Macrostomum lignano TaxID=282301 RepID=A0A267FKB0_9PLAT|nr:hypothetical protein BOX15_Mlig018024g1 [Macrostomum lignano]